MFYNLLMKCLKEKEGSTRIIMMNRIGMRESGMFCPARPWFRGTRI